MVGGSTVSQLISPPLAGWIADRIGCRKIYIVGWTPQLIGVFVPIPLKNAATSVDFPVCSTTGPRQRVCNATTA